MVWFLFPPDTIILTLARTHLRRLQVMIDNFANDPTLKWQYFGSDNGVFRQFPAKEWSKTGPLRPSALSGVCLRGRVEGPGGGGGEWIGVVGEILCVDDDRVK